MRKTVTWLAAGMSAVMASGAFADEVWNTNLGKVVYADEIGSTAVWTYKDGSRDGIIYIQGLAKVYTGRGSYDGYWAQHKSNRACDTTREGIDGHMTAYWGRFHINFTDPDFPSRWQAKWGYCDDKPTNKWNGTPIVGDAQPEPSPVKDVENSFSQAIRFAKGKSSAVIERSIVRGESGYYHFIAKKGQMLGLELSAVDDNAVFAVYKPGYSLMDADDYVEIEGEALNGASTYDQTSYWMGELPVSGKYLIVVGATRGNAAYKLKMSIK